MPTFCLDEGPTPTLSPAKLPRSPEIPSPPMQNDKRHRCFPVEPLTPPMTPPDCSTASSVVTAAGHGSQLSEAVLVDASGSWEVAAYPGLIKEHRRLQWVVYGARARKLINRETVNQGWLLPSLPAITPALPAIVRLQNSSDHIP